MSWTIPSLRDKAREENNRRLERIPSVLPELQFDPPMTYFNNPKCHPKWTEVPYDIFYNFEEGYDPKSWRDDRKSLYPIFENIFKEEERKYIPVTTQLWYGRPRLLENPPDFSGICQRASLIKDFYSPHGVNLSPELEQQPMG